MSSFIVVLDACVIFPAVLRDTLLRAAEAGLYQLQWTDDILEEVRRNLITNRGLSEESARRLIDIMHSSFPDAAITHHKALIEAMPNHPKDRHVMAAAVACRAHVIVTRNLRDFPQAVLTPFSIEAQSPDEFLTHLFDLDGRTMIEIIVQQARDLGNPPKTVSEVLDALFQHTPRFVSLLQKHRDY